MANDSKLGATVLPGSAGRGRNDEQRAAVKPPGSEPGRGPRPAAFRWGLRLARTAVVVVAAVVCWAAFVRTTRTVPSRLAELTVTAPHMAGLAPHPVLAKALPTSGSTLASVRHSAVVDPGHTGIFEIEWQSSVATVQANAGLLVQLMPTASQTKVVLDQARKQYSASRSVNGDAYSLEGRFAVPGVAGAEGITYHVVPLSPSKTNPAGTANVVIFQVGTAAVIELVQSTKSTPGTPGAVALAQAEAAHLRAVPAGFSLSTTSRSVGWSILVLGGGVVVGTSAAVVPEGVVAWRGRRRERQRRRKTREAEFEGRGVARRHRVPSWQLQATQRRTQRRLWRR